MTNKIGKGKRPIFIPLEQSIGVREEEIEFDWHMGMSKQVRQRSIESLHEKAKLKGYHMLEASSKSLQQIGIKLSAFFLLNEQGIAVENLFQGSKVFERGGAFTDLINRNVSPREAKKDGRLRNSGNLIEFNYFNRSFPLEPKSIFYDWLYIKTLSEPQNYQKREELLQANFTGFSDIEFNPKKSINCQARTLALYVSLAKNESVDEFIKDPVETDKKYRLYPSTSDGLLF